MWCKNTQYRTSLTQVLIEYRWNRNKALLIFPSLSPSEFVLFRWLYSLFPLFMSPTCSLSTWNCRNHRWISNCLLRCQRFSSFHLPIVCSFILCSLCGLKSLIFFFEWIQRFKLTHTDAFNSTHAHTFVWVLEYKNHRPDSKFTCCFNCFFCRCTVLRRIFWSAQHCAQKISLHRMRGFYIACWLVGSPLKYMKWFSCYLVSSDKHVHWTCGTWLHADLFVECERRYIRTIFLSTLLFYNSYHMI